MPGRIEKIAAAPGSRDASAERVRFRDALGGTRRASAGADLLVAHKAYVDLRMAAREVVRAARSEFPEEGLVFYTNPRITSGVWNVNVVVTSGTNIPAH